MLMGLFPCVFLCFFIISDSVEDGIMFLVCPVCSNSSDRILLIRYHVIS